MSDKYVIIGNSEHALTMYNYMKATSFGEVISFAVEESYISDNFFCGLPVVAIETLKEKYEICDVRLIMGVGYLQMGNVKEKLFRKCKSLGFKFQNFIHPTAIISSDVKIGEANNILDGVILESGVKLEDGNLIFGGAMVAHDTKIGNFNTLSVKAVVAGCSEVKNHCFIGANATVKDHITISDYALVGAAAYAKSDIGEFQILTPPESIIIPEKRSTDIL